jgi:hypothetical protein
VNGRLRIYVPFVALLLTVASSRAPAAPATYNDRLQSWSSSIRSGSLQWTFGLAGTIQKDYGYGDRCIDSTGGVMIASDRTDATSMLQRRCTTIFRAAMKC